MGDTKDDDEKRANNVGSAAITPVPEGAADTPPTPAPAPAAEPSSPAPSPSPSRTPSAATKAPRKRRRSGSGGLTAAERLDPAARKSDVLNGLIDLATYEPLGGGGFGTVGKVRHRSLDVDVALKIYMAQIVEKYWDRIVAEWKLTLPIPGQIVVKALGPPHREGTFGFNLFEYVRGRTLHEVMKDASGPLAFERARDLSATMLEGLAAAHSVNVVHRDIKPENLIEEEGGALRILDFGLAKVIAEIATQSQIAGTPRYWAPEMIGSGRTTSAVDIYAAGLVAYELFTGTFPWIVPPDNDNGAMAIPLGQLGPPMSATGQMRGKPFSGVLDALLMRMIEWDPSARPTANEALAILKSISSNPRDWYDLRDFGIVVPAPEPSVSPSAEDSGTIKAPAGIRSDATHRVAPAVAVAPDSAARTMKHAPTSSPVPAPAPALATGKAATPAPRRAAGRWPVIAAIAGLVVVVGAGLQWSRARQTTDPSARPPTAPSSSSKTPDLAAPPVINTEAPTPAAHRTLPAVTMAAVAEHVSTPRPAPKVRLAGVDAWLASGDITLENGNDEFVLLSAEIKDDTGTYTWPGPTTINAQGRRVLFHGSWKPSFPTSLHQGSPLVLHVRANGAEGDVTLTVQE